MGHSHRQVQSVHYHQAMAHRTDFDSQLVNSRRLLFDDLSSRKDLKIPESFWDYVEHLERCLWLHYKKPSAWNPDPATHHGGLDEWRKQRNNKSLPFHGRGQESNS